MDHATSQTKYPSFFGIPWLYRHPQSALNHWQKKIQDVFDFSNQQLDQIALNIGQSGQLAATKERLNLLKTGHTQFIKNLKAALGPITSAQVDSEIVSLERVPRQQSAMAYQGTLFRDWVWGEKQIQIYSDFLLPHLKRQKRLAFLGAGACGLPIYIHNQLQPELSLAVDINPLLLIPAKRLADGETLKMVEFPQIPKDSKNVFIEHTLKMNAPLAKGFEFVFCDAQNLPFRQGAIDSIVTSWFIDIVPRDFREMAKVINVALPIDGVWANIGQLGFEKFDLSQVYRPEEIKEILLEAGFEIEHWQTESVPYLLSPYDAVGRQDTVWAFAARKKSHSKKPAVYDYWPSWLSDTKAPIPMTQQVQSFKTRSVIYSMVIDQVNGQRSLAQIAQVLADQFGLPPEQALEAVFSFFSNFYESQIYREF